MRSVSQSAGVLLSLTPSTVPQGLPPSPSAPAGQGQGPGRGGHPGTRASGGGWALGPIDLYIDPVTPSVPASVARALVARSHEVPPAASSPALLCSDRWIGPGPMGVACAFRGAGDARGNVADCPSGGPAQRLCRDAATPTKRVRQRHFGSGSGHDTRPGPRPELHYFVAMPPPPPPPDPPPLPLTPSLSLTKVLEREAMQFTEGPIPLAHAHAHAHARAHARARG